LEKNFCKNGKNIEDSEKVKLDRKEDKGCKIERERELQTETNRETERLREKEVQAVGTQTIKMGRERIKSEKNG